MGQAFESMSGKHIAFLQAQPYFPDLPAAGQIFDLAIDRVQTSCGSSVPEMKVIRHRAELELVPFFEKMSDEGLDAYQKKKNMVSIDGKPTGLAERLQ